MMPLVNPMREQRRTVLHGLITIVASIFLSTCISQEGVMRSNGSITPCNGWHTDNQACGNALFNAKQISRIQLSQTPDEVRAIMKHDAEQMTTLTFTNGRLSTIGKAPWKAQR